VVCWGSNSYGQSTVPNLVFTIDTDGDGINDIDDAFPLNPPETEDTDLDGIGNNADSDDDGVNDNVDVFPLDATKTLDADSDGVGDNADNCPGIINADQLNTDGDSFGNACDADDDGDGVNDSGDAFPLDGSETTDTDSDGIGNNADPDDDGDGVNDAQDFSPLDPSETTDTDGDGIGNNTDIDDDGDGYIDSADALPLNPNEYLDTDGDGIGNNDDTDDDGDGLSDVNDEYPLDTDNDGMPNAWEIKYGLNPNDPSDATSDQDNDGANALAEFLAGTIPAGSIDIDGNGKYEALTDGLLLLRGMFGLTGDALIGGAVASDAVYTTSADIEARIAM
jgi:hypothetical protein